MRIPDIVKKCCSFFRTCSAEELEEATSWSYERWISRGIPHVDLQKYDNPFSYFYRGSFQNMMNRVLQLRRKRLRQEQYEKTVKELIANELPSTQVKDLTSLYD